MSSPERIEKRIKELNANNSEKFLKYIPDLNEKMSFKDFQAHAKTSLKKQGMDFLTNALSKDDYRHLYQNSPVMTAKEKEKLKIELKQAEKKDKISRKKVFKPIKQKVQRRGKVYVRTTPRQWESNTNASLNVIAKYPIRSKKYSEAVNKLVKSTSRSRQAVVKKVQRTRNKLKKSGKK